MPRLPSDPADLGKRRLSHAAYIRRVARGENPQPFYDSIRLFEAAEHITRLEERVSDLTRALSLAIELLDTPGTTFDPAGMKARELVREVQSLHAAPPPPRQIAIGGEVVAGHIVPTRAVILDPVPEQDEQTEETAE